VYKIIKKHRIGLEKLGRLLGYIKGTMELPRIIGANDLTSISCWADTSYVVHHNMRGHSGGVTSLGHGVCHSKCSKQKLNTKSSTKAESDYITLLV